ncbi:hypothetical protein DPMN_140903 [Dreissena polymorpha]|uniref:Uncharacterized protein n=1 Tax=Dreissena polymorpha TaxID=45954 RepID=A0A9D4G8G4_DREPO|nr:hypothetical protein DPMN_140903 [Dreissena polymorpha]
MLVRETDSRGAHGSFQEFGLRLSELFTAYHNDEMSKNKKTMVNSHNAAAEKMLRSLLKMPKYQGHLVVKSRQNWEHCSDSHKKINVSSGSTLCA